MSMKALEDLKETLCAELEEISHKTKMSAGDLETAHKLTGTIKNVEEIMMFDDEEYSQAGDWTAEMRGNYGRGSSYAGRKRDSMGRYSRNSYARDGRYSRADGRDSMIDRLEEMERDATSDKEREAIRRCISQLERA